MPVLQIEITKTQHEQIKRHARKNGNQKMAVIKAEIIEHYINEVVREEKK